jgi:hypothetical protein
MLRLWDGVVLTFNCLMQCLVCNSCFDLSVIIGMDIHGAIPMADSDLCV